MLVFRLVTVIACATTLAAYGLWWLRENGTLVPILAPYSTRAILVLLYLTQLTAGLCIALVPRLWSGARWSRLATWRWESVALPVLPWVSQVLGPIFDGPERVGLLGTTAWMAAVALALAFLQRDLNNPERQPPARVTRAVTTTVRVIAMVAAAVEMFAVATITVLFGTVPMPARAWFVIEGSELYIYEEISSFDMDSSINVWWQDGLVFRSGPR